MLKLAEMTKLQRLNYFFQVGMMPKNDPFDCLNILFDYILNYFRVNECLSTNKLINKQLFIAHRNQNLLAEIRIYIFQIHIFHLQNECLIYLVHLVYKMDIFVFDTDRRYNIEPMHDRLHYYCK